jgi:hypothetical protein
MRTETRVRPSAASASRALLVVAAACVALAPAATARAQSLSGSAATYFRGFSRPTGNDAATYVPFYEIVELHARKLGLEGLSLHTGFFGMVDILDRQDLYAATGDLSTLYIEYKAPEEGKLRFLRGLEVAGGRQYVTLGPTILEQIDGGKIHYRSPSGYEVGVFGGAPTGVRLAFQPWPIDQDEYAYGYDWLVGGRAGFLDLGRFGGGVSYVHRRYRGRVADNDLGWDLSLTPLSMLDLAGSAVLSLEALRLKEAKGQAAVRVFRPLSLSVGYHLYAPDLWVPRTSIFAVFSEALYQEASASARYVITRALSVDGTYGRRVYGGYTDTQGNDHSGGGANRASLRGVLRFLGTGRALAEFEHLETTDNMAERLRFAAAVPVRLFRREIRLVADFDILVLKEAIHDSRFSFSGTGYIEAPLLANLSLLGGGGGGVSPLLSRELSFLLRVVWSFEQGALASSTGVEVQRGRL